jgi:DNA mismatch repair protein MutL
MAVHETPLLHRAVMQCYETLIQPDQIPPYFIFLETDPAQIDVNIHRQDRDQI